jgi:peroxiredoxin Q/BCP
MVVLGISPDTVKDRGNFREKYDFPYPLLADVDNYLAEAYACGC